MWRALVGLLVGALAEETEPKTHCCTAPEVYVNLQASAPPWHARGAVDASSIPLNVHKPPEQEVGIVDVPLVPAYEKEHPPPPQYCAHLTPVQLKELAPPKHAWSQFPPEHWNLHEPPCDTWMHPPCGQSNASALPLLQD